MTNAIVVAPAPGSLECHDYEDCDCRPACLDSWFLIAKERNTILAEEGALASALILILILILCTKKGMKVIMFMKKIQEEYLWESSLVSLSVA